MRFDCNEHMCNVVKNHLSVELSITDTWGPGGSFTIQRFPLYRGCVVWITVYLGPHKQSVVENFCYLGTLLEEAPRYHNKNVYIYIC